MATILSVVPFHVIPPKTGGQNGIARFIDFLGRRHKLLIVSTNLNTKEHSYQYTIYPILSTSRFRYLNVFTLFSIVKLGRKNKVQYLIAEQPFIAYQVYLASLILKLPYYLHNHNIEFERARTTGKKWWKLVKPVEKFAMRKADVLFFKTKEDRDIACNAFHISIDKTYIIPYGVNNDKLPADKEEKRKKVVQRHRLNPSEKILFFFGVMNYQPNVIATEFIIEKIVPLLALRYPDFKYKILICGKGLPLDLVERIKKSDTIEYVGFVEDIDEYIIASDVMINPIISGGGIKTKVVEALGFDTTVVSAKTGAIGIEPAVCGGKLLISGDDDWQTFTDNVVKGSNQAQHTPQSFFDVFYWGNIVKGMDKFFT